MIGDRLSRGIAATVLLGLSAFALSYVVALELVPLSEWGWLVALVVAFVLGGSVAAITWFITVASLIGELEGDGFEEGIKI